MSEDAIRARAEARRLRLLARASNRMDTFGAIGTEAPEDVGFGNSPDSSLAYSSSEVNGASCAIDTPIPSSNPALDTGSPAVNMVSSTRTIESNKPASKAELVEDTNDNMYKPEKPRPIVTLHKVIFGQTRAAKGWRAFSVGAILALLQQYVGFCFVSISLVAAYGSLAIFSYGLKPSERKQLPSDNANPALKNLLGGGTGMGAMLGWVNRGVLAMNISQELVLAFVGFKVSQGFILIQVAVMKLIPAILENIKNDEL